MYLLMLGGGLICDIKTLHQYSALKMRRGLGARVGEGGGGVFAGNYGTFVMVDIAASFVCMLVLEWPSLHLYMQSDYGELHVNSNLLVILWYWY